MGAPALAADYIVVSSSDPGIKRGTSIDAGQKIALPAGATITLMRASGEVTTLRGSASGAVAPRAKLAAADAARFETLHALVQPPPEGRTFGGRREGVCPAVASLTTLDDIVSAAETSGCNAVAREALDAYLGTAARQMPATPRPAALPPTVGPGGAVGTRPASPTPPPRPQGP